MLVHVLQTQRGVSRLGEESRQLLQISLVRDNGMFRQAALVAEVSLEILDEFQERAMARHSPTLVGSREAPKINVLPARH